MKKRLALMLSLVLAMVMACSSLTTAFVSVPATSVKIIKAKETVVRKNTVKLAVTMAPSNATVGTLKWSSENPAVATVNENGFVTGKSVGTTVVTMKTDDGKFTSSINITVKEEFSPSEAIPITVVAQNDYPQDPKSPVTPLLAKAYGLQVKYVYLERSKLTELLSLRIASGDVPDWMLLTPVLYSAFSNGKVLAEVPESLVQNYAPNFYKENLQASNNANLYNFYKIKGKMYGLPGLQYGSNVNYVPIWRDDWLKNVGITKIPDTIAEAEVAFYKFRNDDPDKNGKKDTYAMSSHGFAAIYGAYGGWPQAKDWNFKVTKTGKIGFVAVQPEMRDALKLLNKWYKDGLIDPEFITGENKGQYWANSPGFFGGTLGFSVPGVWYHSINPETVNNEILKGQTPIPLKDITGYANYDIFKKANGPNATYKEGFPFKKDANSEAGIRHWSCITGTAVAFGKKVTRDPRIMERLLCMVERYNNYEEDWKLNSLGIEGLTYEKNTNPAGTPYLMKAPYLNDGVKTASLGIGANGLISPNANNEMLDKLGKAPYQAAFINKYGSIVKNWENCIFIPPASWGTYGSAITKKCDENYALFITGQRSLGEWDAFVNDLMSAGLKQVTKEAQDWYSKYIK